MLALLAVTLVWGAASGALRAPTDARVWIAGLAAGLGAASSLVRRSRTPHAGVTRG